MAVIGKNILENLTTGMYSDAKICYREYIQNSCDQIDLAVELGMLSLEEAMIDIEINQSAKYIRIHDNATGVKASKFEADLGDIANSSKRVGKNKGFRGIGRLCGLAYCKSLIFSTSYLGEATKSIMICDAEKMRQMLSDDKQYSVDEVLESIVTFKSEEEDRKAHYFNVELVDVVDTASELLNENSIYDYLSFVAPVDYENKFYNRSEIYKYIKDNNIKIDIYRIFINGRDLLKAYNTYLKEGTDYPKKYDEISKLVFKKFYNEDGELLAWMWYGLSRLEKQIPPVNKMRGLRLRQANIQIGDEKTLSGLFKEPRGNLYYIGEVFATHKGLIANSQRDYFNQNIYRLQLECVLSEYFRTTLTKLYYNANKFKNDCKKLQDINQQVVEFNQKIVDNSFINEELKNKEKEKIEALQKDAIKIQKEIDKIQNTETSEPFNFVKERISKKYEAELNKDRVKIVDSKSKKQSKDNYLANSFASLSKKERKHIQTVMSIITEIAPKEVAEKIIIRIKEEFK